MNKIIIFIFTFFIILYGCGNNSKEDKSIIKDQSDSIKKSDSVKNRDDIPKKFAVSKYPTPVLNSANFESVYGGKDSMILKRNKNGLIKELEYVAQPGTVFEILEEYKKNGYSIYKVYTKEYDIPDLNISLYIDSRFVEVMDTMPNEKKITKPNISEIYNYLDKSIGTLYIWGANNIQGVDKMKEFYKPKRKLSIKEEKEWTMKGLDCSGLLYEATNGFTPRHTYQLVYFGDPVLIEGLDADEIISRIEPLDLIVWKGHVIIVYDKSTTIESSYRAKGVVKKNLTDVINQLLKTRKPVNEWNDANYKKFVIRRWVHLLYQ